MIEPIRPGPWRRGVRACIALAMALALGLAGLALVDRFRAAAPHANVGGEAPAFAIAGPRSIEAGTPTRGGPDLRATTADPSSRRASGDDVEPPRLVSAAQKWQRFKSTGDLAALDDAVVALRRCKLFRASLAPQQVWPDSPAAQRRHGAQRRIVERACANPEQEPGDAELDSAVQDGASRGNTYLAALSAQRHALSTGQAPGRDARLCEWLVASKDKPEILGLMAPILTNASRQTLHGKPFNLRRRVALQGALDILPCELGADCGPLSWRAMRACALDGYCPELPDGYAGALLRLGLADDKARSEAVELKDALKRDILQGSCGEFAAP